MPVSLSVLIREIGASVKNTRNNLRKVPAERIVFSKQQTILTISRKMWRI